MSFPQGNQVAGQQYCNSSISCNQIKYISPKISKICSMYCVLSRAIYSQCFQVSHITQWWKSCFSSIQVTDSPEHRNLIKNKNIIISIHINYQSYGIGELYSQVSYFCQKGNARRNRPTETTPLNHSVGSKFQLEYVIINEIMPLIPTQTSDSTKLSQFFKFCPVLYKIGYLSCELIICNPTALN